MNLFFIYNPYELYPFQTRDTDLFLFLNGFHTPFLDIFMAFITHKYSSIPLYLFLIYLVIKKHTKQAPKILLAVVIAVGLADRFTSGFLKPHFERLRPCHNPSLSKMIHLVGDCGGQYGFASSHAANSFALAMFFYMLFGETFSQIKWLWFWAFLVSYSRIYVGVHYPADVLVGAIVGLVFSFLSFRIFKLKTIITQ